MSKRVKLASMRKVIHNKIAFQDAYRPLVDHISQHALCRGCVSAMGVSAPGGAWSLRGVCSGGGVVSQHALRQTPPCEQNS